MYFGHVNLKGKHDMLNGNFKGTKHLILKGSLKQIEHVFLKGTFKGYKTCNVER